MVQLTYIEHLPLAKQDFEFSICIYLIEFSQEQKVGLYDFSFYDWVTTEMLNILPELNS